MKIGTELTNLPLQQPQPVKEKVELPIEVKKDFAEVSNTGKAFDRALDFFNLSKGKDVTLSGLNSEEKKEFIKILASLIEKGITGFEEFEINGKRHKIFIENEIGDERLYNAKIKYVNEKNQ